MNNDKTVTDKAKLTPCRLYVIQAREAPIAVIFRRGPTKWVQIVKWDMATDTFTSGQWFHGRIYERRSDLSPNGELLVYSARKSQARTVNPEYTDHWTAISKPPYLTALALWPCQASVGGGLFFSDTKVWLNYYRTPQPHPNHLPKGLWIYAAGNDVLEPVMLDRRLKRDGWQHIQELQGESIESPWGKAHREREQTGLPPDFDWYKTLGRLSTNSRYLLREPGIDEKPNSDQSLTLVMKTTTRNGYSLRYAYSIRDAEGREEPLTGAEWADWDYRGRLVFARDGKIFALSPDGIGHAEPQELADLNGHKPEPMVAPDWAKVW